MPRVSIVMPTRNRAHLLKTALASALRQTYADIEIIVSDNYCGNDETRKVFDSFNDPRLRYVRTSELLSMPDSWEFALNHAQGDYVTYLTDDSYLFPDAIEKAIQAATQLDVKLVAWNMCRYFFPDWLDLSRRNCLYVNKSSLQRRLLASEEVLSKIFDLQSPDCLPRFLNSLCHRDLLTKVMEAQGRVFLPPCPDYSAAASVLVNTDKYVFLDWSLMIEGITPASIGASQNFDYGPAAREFLREFRGETEFVKLIDLNLPTVFVSVAQSLVNVKRFYPESISHEINKENLLLFSVHALVTHERNGTDVGEAWQALGQYLAQQPDDVRRAAFRQKRRSRVILGTKDFLRSLRGLPGWEYLDKLRGIYTFRGDRWGFHSMRECGEVAPDLVRRVIAHRNHSA